MTALAVALVVLSAFNLVMFYVTAARRREEINTAYRLGRQDTLHEVEQLIGTDTRVGDGKTPFKDLPRIKTWEP